ncbi:MAG: hypothetical protein IBX72_03875 [Nitrospirae bacterium]|nr:hypothetical protein [Nitrospirota bacterium]
MMLCCFKEDKNILDLIEQVIEEGRNLNVSSRLIAETIIQRLLEMTKKQKGDKR